MDIPDDNTASLSSDRPDGRPLRQLGPFRVESLISAGGMGSVYRAFDESMKRHVALKILHPSMALSSGTQHRFAREAWIAGRLEHPAIVKVFSRGEENGINYLAMELVDGGSLADELAAVRKSEPSPAASGVTADSQYIRSVVTRFIELIEGLAYVHEKGFIHRDIKPQNILVSGAEKRLRLTDFGIAHAADMTQMTKPGDFIGTVRYMSPEQLAAHRATVDRRTDLYSIGVTLYEALTLSLPYDGSTDEQYVAAILGGRSTPIRRRNLRISRDLETIILTAIHHDPDRRYQTASALAEDLRRFLENRPILARREGLVARGVKFAARHKASVLGIGIIAAIALAGYFAIAPQIRMSRNRGLLLQTLRSAYQLKQDPAEVNPAYAELIPDLVRIVTRHPEDSVAYWFHRLHGAAKPHATVMPNDSDNRLYVGGGDISSHVEGDFDDSPYFVTVCRILVTVDSTDPRQLGAYGGYYSVLNSTSGFMLEASIDTLVNGQPGMHELRVELIAEHYRDALLYLRRPPRDETRPQQDTNGFEMIPRTTSVSWVGGLGKCRILAADGKSPAVPFLIDTNRISTPVYASPTAPR